ncbi:PepSY domain-containing protein [Methylocella sp.]|uniref:PepSY domain-containing protein n=1 Tax=Methylocella sp. TaxID=1978226 RepID=UPI003783B3A4
MSFSSLATLRTLVRLGALACLGAQAARAEPLTCFSPGETRERIRVDGLAEPLAPMRRVAAKLQAEALNARLCRNDDSFVYEISVLTREGKIMRAFIDARSGQPLGGAAAVRR